MNKKNKLFKQELKLFEDLRLKVRAIILKNIMELEQKRMEKLKK